MDETFGQAITHAIAWLTGAVIVLGITLVTVSGVGWYYVNRTAENNNATLCAYRSDLQDRADSARAFLKLNPNGFAGVSAATIRQTISNQQQALDSIAVLDCS